MDGIVDLNTLQIWQHCENLTLCPLQSQAMTGRRSQLAETVVKMVLSSWKFLSSLIAT